MKHNPKSPGDVSRVEIVEELRDMKKAVEKLAERGRNELYEVTERADLLLQSFDLTDLSVSLYPSCEGKNGGWGGGRVDIYITSGHDERVCFDMAEALEEAKGSDYAPLLFNTMRKILAKLPKYETD